VPPRAFERIDTGPARPKNLYIREDRILPHLPAVYLLLAAAEPAARHRRRRTRQGADVRRPASDQDVIGYLRTRQITLTYDPRTGTLQAGSPDAVTTVIGHAS
jgi:site-specific DNA recombinase